MQRPETGLCPADLKGGGEMRQKRNGNWVLQGLVVHWGHATLLLRGRGSQGGLRADECHPRGRGPYFHRILSAAECGPDPSGQGRSREARRAAVTVPPASLTELPPVASSFGVRPVVIVETPHSLSKGCASLVRACPGRTTVPGVNEWTPGRRSLL